MHKQGYKVEVCIDNYSDAMYALNKGADQLEVCSSLHLDGLTPDIKLVEKLIRKTSKELKVMIRPRSGNFIYTSLEKSIMRQQVEKFSALGILHFVTGMLLEDHTIDIMGMHDLSNNLDVIFTFHKAIDSVRCIPDQLDNLSQVKNVKYILSSGGKNTAAEGKELLRNLVYNYQDRFKIIPAGKITSENLADIHNFIGAEYYHGKKILG